MAKAKRILDLSALDIDGNDVVVNEEELERVYNYTPPSALTMGVRDTNCRGCGATHRAILGIFLEYHSNKAMRLERVEPDRMAGYYYLPRRLDYAPAETVPICPYCWHSTPLFERAFPVTSHTPEPLL